MKKHFLSQSLIVGIISLILVIPSCTNEMDKFSEVSDKNVNEINDPFIISQIYTNNLSYSNENNTWELTLSNKDALSMGISQDLYDKWLNSINSCNQNIVKAIEENKVDLRSTGSNLVQYPRGYLLDFKEMKPSSGYCTTCRYQENYSTVFKKVPNVTYANGIDLMVSTSKGYFVEVYIMQVGAQYNVGYKGVDEIFGFSSVVIPINSKGNCDYVVGAAIQKIYDSINDRKEPYVMAMITVR